MEATENGTLEERAQEDCTTYVSGLPLAAAMDADAGTVRRLVADLGTRGDWETGLPVDEDEYVAICVYDVGSVDGLVDDPSFMAYWVTAQASREFVAWG